MKAYSQDLRERVMTVVKAGKQSRLEIAKMFEISESTIDKWWRRWRETGRVTASPFAGGRRRALKTSQAVIQAEVKRQPDVTLSELCERVERRTGVSASRSMMSRELQILALPRKKSRSMIATVTRRG